MSKTRPPYPAAFREQIVELARAGTRADPLGEVWETEVVPMLRAAPALMAVTLLEKLQQRYPNS